jgi:hypothetical protein
VVLFALFINYLHKFDMACLEDPLSASPASIPPRRDNNGRSRRHQLDCSLLESEIGSLLWVNIRVVSINTRLAYLLSNARHVVIPDQGQRRVVGTVVVVLVEDGLRVAGRRGTR